MNRKSVNTALTLALVFVMIANSVQACSWAAFVNGKAAVVARTFDWYEDDHVVVKGHGRGVKIKAGEGDNALEYVTKYASIQLHSFSGGFVAEGLNEKGLQGSILFLDGSVLPKPKPNRKDLDPINFIGYAVSSFATVQEVVDSLETVNFIAPNSITVPGPDGEPLEYPEGTWPLHFAFVDATGDKVIFEFIKGEIKAYHGKEYDALSNEPAYDVHLLADYVDYTPNGTIGTVDRRIRAKHYMRDMRERGVETPRRALLAMRGLIATVLAGTEEIDRQENEVYPTIWSCLADQHAGRYYVSHYDRWCSEIYDFSMFNPATPEVVTLNAAECPYPEMETDA